MAPHEHHRPADTLEDDNFSGVCIHHSGVTATMEERERNRIEAEALNKANHEAQWAAIEKMREGINGMVRWICGAMGMLILAFITWILTNFGIIHLAK